MASLTWYGYGNSSSSTYLYLKVYYTITESNPSTITINDVAMCCNYRQESWRFDGKITINGVTIGSSFNFSGNSFDERSTNSSYTKKVNVTSTANVAFNVNGTFVYTGSGSSADSQTISSTKSVYVHVYAKHALAISAGTGSSISVQRLSSKMLSAGVLSDSDVIYEGDELQIAFAISEGYDFTAHTVNGESFVSGNTYTVPDVLSDNILNVVSSAIVKSFTLSISVGEGSTISVSRTESLLQGAATGPLKHSDTIYYSDKLHILVDANEGYNILTGNVNGSNILNSAGSHTNITVTNNVSVSTTAALKSYTLTINPDDGSEIIVVRKRSAQPNAVMGAITNGATIYHFDTLTITFNSDPEHEILMQTVNGQDFVSGDSIDVSGDVQIITVTGWLGIIYVHNGTTFDRHCVFIYGDSGWEQYIPYVYNGSSWDQCS